MEQLNKVELMGIVGSVRTNKMGDKPCARLSVVTNHAFKDRNGGAVIESTWHNVVAFEGKDVTCLERLEKGDTVRVLGRLRNVMIRDNEGAERSVTEIVASSLETIEHR